MNIASLEKLGLSISDCTGSLRDIDAIIGELEELEGSFNTTAMSEYTLVLQGQRQMLQEIIKYLKRC